MTHNVGATLRITSNPFIRSLPCNSSSRSGQGEPLEAWMISVVLARYSNVTGQYLESTLSAELDEGVRSYPQPSLVRDETKQQES